MEPIRSHATAIGVLLTLRGRKMTCREIAAELDVRRIETIRKMVRKLHRAGVLRFAGVGTVARGTKPYKYACVNLAPPDEA